MFSKSSKVTFSVLIVLFKAEITVPKLTFNIRVGKIRFGIRRVTFLRTLFYFYHLKTSGCTCGFCAVGIYHVRTEMGQSLLSFNMC